MTSDDCKVNNIDLEGNERMLTDSKSFGFEKMRTYHHRFRNTFGRGRIIIEGEVE
jgi:hypothetical protein